jgi:hypothetical protein
MQTRPTLLNSCARAATAAEARFRINAAPQTPRASCVVALDNGAAAVVRELVGLPWHGARFLSCRNGSGPEPADTRELADIMLNTVGGAEVRLSEALVDTDFMLMVATVKEGAAAASTIGNACALRGIMTAGVVIGSDRDSSGAVFALRPHARVLLVTNDEQDVGALMSAVGA